jgi:uncharacterized protein YbjT (DUF2867 family)
MMQRNAIVLGATGLTGRHLVDRLVADDRYGEIKLFSRRSSEHPSPRIREFIGDILHLEQFREDFTADVVFCCVGTTSSKTRDRNIYRAIDYGIPFHAARLAIENGIPSFLVISSIGANPKSRVFYTRTKGEMEEAVLALQVPHTYILRPSLILGDRNERRWAEKAGAVVMKSVSFLMTGGLRNYRPIEAATIASAMIHLDQVRPELKIVHSARIQEFGNR